MQRRCKAAKGAFMRWNSMRSSRHRTLFDPLLQALQLGAPHAQRLGTGSYGSITRCWVRGHGLVALKRSLTSADAIRAEAKINRRIPPHPCIAQVGARQHPLSAQEGMLAACLSCSGIQPSLPGSSCVAQSVRPPMKVIYLHCCIPAGRWLPCLHLGAHAPC